MAEEQHRCEAQEGHRLCVNNCGFFGSPATLNLCSKCYGELRLKQPQQPSPPLSSSTPSPAVNLIVTASPEKVVSSLMTWPADVAAQPSRCLVCRKKLGLMGFKCRCGTTFCGAHRYPEMHGCEFDFKKVGRDEITRANPVIKAAKLDKI